MDDSLKEYGIDEEKFKELNCSAGTIIAIVNSYPKVEAELKEEFVSHYNGGEQNGSTTR